MLEWVPAWIRLQYGLVEDSALNGPFLRLVGRAEIVKAFESVGFRCELDDGLVEGASGR